jgi:putative ABC transport system permease protein
MTEGDTEAYVVEGESALPKGQFNVHHHYIQSASSVGTLQHPTLLQIGTDRLQVAGCHLAVERIGFLTKKHFPGRSAVGKRVRFGDSEDDTKNPWWMIVGVVRDIRERGLLFDMKPAIYVPVTQVQDLQRYSNLVLRTSNDPETSTKATESAVWSLDAQQPVMHIRTMDQLIEENVADRTRPMVLLGVFAGLALVLACLGVYGVLAYAVAQRTREIGVRMALGAKPSDVTRMVRRSGLRLSGLGLVAGAVLAFALSSLLRSLLFGVTAIAPSIYLATAAVLLFVALAACVIPAQRASRVDPMLALRDE